MWIKFQSTHSVWSATHKLFAKIIFVENISIHALRVECDSEDEEKIRIALLFQSTHSVWSATPLITPLHKVVNIFQSTHSVWSATYESRWYYVEKYFISIHALRVECDRWFATRFTAIWISIHALRVECDAGALLGGRVEFNISIHALRVECDVNSWLADLGDIISIHALRVECDNRYFTWCTTKSLFQSTHSVWSATVVRVRILQMLTYFNPRTPCGVRRINKDVYPIIALISIHALRVECDSR